MDVIHSKKKIMWNLKYDNIWIRCQKMSQPINYCIKWSKILFNIAHVKHYVLLLMIWDFDLKFSIFLTFSYFWAFTLFSSKKIASFTFLRYFNLKVEWLQRSAFYLPLFASMIMKYTISNHIRSPSYLLKVSGPAPGFVFKKKPPKKESSK